jgi:sec-independent protein translocase protein TatB
MFGIDFPELVVCAIVALIVVGPKRLPEVVRTTALWIGRFKRSMRETRENIERQIGVDDIRRQLHTEEMMRTLDDMKEEIETALNYERMGNKLMPQQDTATNETSGQAALSQTTSYSEDGSVLSVTENSTSLIELEKVTMSESVSSEKLASSPSIH